VLGSSANKYGITQIRTYCRHDNRHLSISTYLIFSIVDTTIGQYLPNKISINENFGESPGTSQDKIYCGGRTLQPHRQADKACTCSLQFSAPISTQHTLQLQPPPASHLTLIAAISTTK